MTIYFMYFLIPLLVLLSAMFVWRIFFQTSPYTRQTLYPSQLPIYHEQLTTGREKEIRRIAGQILTGQSSAIVGAFSSDRTLILNALRNPELYGDKADRLKFSLLDISSLDINCTPLQFWDKALKPLPEKIADESDSGLSKAYQACQDNQFENFYLDKLFAQLKQENWRLVLMLDRFEALLHRSNLDNSEFLGGLRMLASSRYPSPLSLIIAGDISLHQFHQDTKDLNPMGSPYLNFMESGEITLGALSESEIDKLLNQSEQQFTDEERQFIKDVAGGHPHLLQLAVSALWNAYENEEENPLKSAEQLFYNRTKSMLNNMLQSWSANTRQAFFSVAKNGKVSDFKNELEELEKQGFVINNNGTWQIRSRVLSKFVAN